MLPQRFIFIFQWLPNLSDFDFPYNYLMTLYFRPDTADYQESSDRDSKAAEKHYSIILHLIKVEKEQKKKLFSYHLEEENSEFINNSRFIGLLVKGNYELQITNKISGDILGTETLELPEWIKDFKGCKNNKFEKQVKIGDYIISCSYGYNRFLQICGMSRFYDFRTEPSGLIDEKMMKVNHQIIIASKEKLKQSHAQQPIRRQLDYIVEEESHFQNEESSFKGNQVNRGVNDSSVNKGKESQVKNLIDESSVFKPANESTNSTGAFKKQLNSKQQVKYYKGHCKTANFFSCLDPHSNVQKEFNFVEPSFQ